MEYKKYTAEKLTLKIADKIGMLGCLLEDLEYVKNVLGRMAADAKDKYSGERQQHFLWDNNDTLQMLDILMFRLLTEINKEYKQIDEMQSLLRELTKVRKLDEEKSPLLTANE